MSSRLGAVAAHLPFAVDDYDAANDAFARWRATGHDGALRDVELWLYVYTQRYFLTRFARERGAASDLDACVERVLARVRARFDAIERTDRFASYVSVVCKNTLRNHRRDRRETVAVDEALAAHAPGTTLVADPVRDYDAALVRRQVEAAIASLPDALREITRLRVLERRPYEAVAELTGHPLATVRTYASRGTARLRGHPRLRAFFFDDLAPPLPESSAPVSS